MKYKKVFLSFKEQVELLEKRGIIFKKITKFEAEEKISHINYFKLSGYIKKFEKEKDLYKNIDFQEILDLYYFDRELRSMLFHAIEKIQISFKTKLAYYIGKETRNTGANSYINFELWTNKNKVINKENNTIWNDIEREKFKNENKNFIKNIKSYTKRGKKEFVENYFNKYDEEILPIWMVVEVLDFGISSGELEKLKKILKDLEV